MSTKEKERLHKLQRSADKSVAGDTPTKLTYSDLLLLLREDVTLRELLREVVAKGAPENSAVTANDGPPVTAPVAIAPQHTPLPAAKMSTDPLRQQLGPELKLLAQVRSDAELTALWLPESDEAEGRQLIRLVAQLAQWDQILQLWERLAERCKQEQRPVTAEERQILTAALEIHNLLWRSRAAQLQTVSAGGAFEYQQHQRGSTTGTTIRAEWLPGLLNAAGQLQKKPLVET